MSLYVVVWIYFDLKVYSFVDVKGGLNFKWNVDIVVFCDEVLLDCFYDVVVNLEFYDVGGSLNRFIGFVLFFLFDLFGNIFMNYKEYSDLVFLNLLVSMMFFIDFKFIIRFWC